jgi:type IV fimbrial biogenesis protein FimT
MYTNCNAEFFQKGFSLIELMMVLAITAIIAVTAAPSFTKNIQDNRLKTNAQSLFTLIKSARADSMVKNQSIYLGNGLNTSAYNNNFQSWVESNPAASIVSFVSTDDDLLQVVELSGAANISVSGAVNNVFGFGADGMMASGGAIELEICDGRTGELGRKITILATGISVLNEFTCT